MAEKEEDEPEVCSVDPSTNTEKCEKKRVNTLYRCPEQSCGQEFLSEHNLERHILIGDHRSSPIKRNFRDYTLNGFSKFLEFVSPKRVCKIVDDAIESSLDDNGNGKVQKMGWALPAKRKSIRHTERAKSYIKAIYDRGEKTGVKVDARSAAKKMREERKVDGTMYFQPGELLNSKQIASLFSTYKRLKLDEKEGKVLIFPFKFCLYFIRSTSVG